VLVGFRGLTREVCALDLRQFHNLVPCPLSLFAVRRSDIEGFARDLEARGRARATVARRLCEPSPVFRYAVVEERLEHSPAAYVLCP
jgi:site-specific recombinase XerD